MKKFFVGYLMLSLFSVLCFNLKSSENASKRVLSPLDEWKLKSVEMRRSCSEKILQGSDDEWQDVDGLTLEIKNEIKNEKKHEQKTQEKKEIKRPIAQVPTSSTHSQAPSNASTVIDHELAQGEQSIIVRPGISSFRRRNSFESNSFHTEKASFSNVHNNDQDNSVDSCLLGAVAFGAYLFKKAQEAFNEFSFDARSQEAKDIQKKTDHKD